ncbi:MULTISPECIES: type 1 glutamine amidotransferase domain-containing protein [Idiomarina]|jgi:putative intracellular protease/amidase|uniref:type 1 glutamine amidotransferase domain-containing protein n=1 Tax=Idiomarina TaxID=135575 RepID=UPI0007937523|nr:MULTISPECIES: type 1 glutamine amidotransferase domain-containing protein [Idiomarina]KXS34108.1 MAG: ThiJ/PfpI domain-containing protein [Idiomarina sp. T82-3]MBL73200.1 type 1 glutamine amidotransferase domain-containing protein [Idiomarinaceae bacterium]|tara:strand:+ start:2389 stop:3243 length:855 start_codon:yes stop_codon:yes gene_type:complete
MTIGFIKSLLLTATLGAVLLFCQAAVASKGKVLVLLSSETQLELADGSQYPTGYYLNEFGVPADALQQAGYELVLVTPKGNAPRVDQRSVDTQYFGGDEQEMQRIQKVIANLDGINDTHKLADVLKSDLSQFDGLFIPGGHAPLIDLVGNPEVGKLLTYFHNQQKPTAAICHGPIALLSPQQMPTQFIDQFAKEGQSQAQDWIYEGYNMTIFSTPEEQVFERSLNGKQIRYYPAAAMQAAGANLEQAEAWQPNVVIDRELITGQNPFSDKVLAEALIKQLEQAQ